MDRFTRLFCEIERTNRTSEKVSALEQYFREVPPSDAAWALQFLSGRTPERVVSTRHLWNWTLAESGLPHWLMEECQDAVGDLAETMALVFPQSGQGTQLSLSEIVEQRLHRMTHLPEIARRELLIATWRELNAEQRLVWNKLITGAFRIGVASTLVIRALANVAGIPPAIMAHRVMGSWQPHAEDFQRLLSGDVSSTETARPYPFFLASPIEIKLKEGASVPEILGEIHDWQIEWKWDGIRAQLIRRGGETLVWSRGEEMITHSFPEIAEDGSRLPNGTVLDGEILAWRGDRPLPFSQLQRRLGRKRVTGALREQFPIAFLCYDVLEVESTDIRGWPLFQRRLKLEALLEEAGQQSVASDRNPDKQTTLELFHDLQGTVVSGRVLRLSPVVRAATWEDVAEIQKQARECGTEGLMLKRRDSPYRVGRQRGDWWKWKVDPYVIDAVLVYAQRGQGRRASLYTDYTFGVWDNEELVPVAKAYSGLSDEEIRQVDAFVRHNTLEKHGPVRVVKPELVFELAFEGIQASTRHRGGIAVRFPRMNRWRHDKQPRQADTLANLREMLKEGYSAHQRIFALHRRASGARGLPT